MNKKTNLQVKYTRNINLQYIYEKYSILSENKVIQIKAKRYFYPVG